LPRGHPHSRYEAEFNDQVTSISLVDVRGAFGISYDPGTGSRASTSRPKSSVWYLAVAACDLHIEALVAVLHRALRCIERVDPFSPNIETIYSLRLLQGFSRAHHPLLMTTALRALAPQSRLYGLAVYALSATFTPQWRKPRRAVDRSRGLALRVLSAFRSAHWRECSFGMAIRRTNRIMSVSTCSTGKACCFSWWGSARSAHAVSSDAWTGSIRR